MECVELHSFVPLASSWATAQAWTPRGAERRPTEISLALLRALRVEVDKLEQGSPGAILLDSVDPALLARD